MSCAELSACVAPLALLERAGCGLVVFCGCLAGGAACLAHLALAGRPCLSLCLLAVAKASVGSSLAVLPAWLLEGAPCPGHLAHLAQAAELAAFPVVPLLFPADSPETTLAVLSALLAFSCALSLLACDTRRVRGFWCLWRPDAPWGAWSWEKSRDMKCRSIAWEFKYPQVPSPIPSLVKRQEERKHEGRCSGRLRLAEVVRVTVV
ncbi:uncharacterized protein LOC142591806 [Dermacentor variabilis]|uniref:uncharacterized protein LOC142591806 n=1 Tax=Dermacentor variabilis TaxID=34621 RepID=UPI003F5B2C69